MTYQEHAKADIDWQNEYNISYTIPAYFFRYDNYNFYLKTGNDFILKSTFGKKPIWEIEDEIERFFTKSIGSYNTIK